MAVRPGDEARKRAFRGIGSWSDRTIGEMGDWIFMAAPFALATLVGRCLVQRLFRTRNTPELNRCQTRETARASLSRPTESLPELQNTQSRKPNRTRQVLMHIEGEKIIPNPSPSPTPDPGTTLGPGTVVEAIQPCYCYA
jgi:hypothetical protein